MNDYKQEARRLEQFLKSKLNLEVQYSQLLEAVAAMHGAQDWNTLSAAQSVPAERESPAAQPLSLTEEQLTAFMQYRWEEGEWESEDIPVRLARFGLMDPAVFVSEMKERLEAVGLVIYSDCESNNAGEPKFWSTGGRWSILAQAERFFPAEHPLPQLPRTTGNDACWVPVPLAKCDMYAWPPQSKLTCEAQSFVVAYEQAGVPGVQFFKCQAEDAKHAEAQYDNWVGADEKVLAAYSEIGVVPERLSLLQPGDEVQWNDPADVAVIPEILQFHGVSEAWWDATPEGTKEDLAAEAGVCFPGSSGTYKIVAINSESGRIESEDTIVLLANEEGSEAEVLPGELG